MTGAGSTTGRLADLARAGYAVLRQPSMQVDYEVHHLVDRPGRLLELLAREDEQDMFAETLSAAAYDVGVVVGTRTVGRSGRAAPPARDVEGGSFRGTARPDPTFADEPEERFEGVISVEDEPRGLTVPHGLGLRDALLEVARLALQEGEPLLSVQCPAQLPAVTSRRGSGRVGATARSTAHALRFSMALTRPRAEVRLRLAGRLAEYCRDRGLGLRLADTRSGYRAGDWFTVQPHRRQVARARHDPAGVVRPVSVEGCLPVTIIGPARLSTTHAVVDFLARHPAAGLLAATLSTLDDLAVIHLQLVLNQATRRRIAGVNRTLESWVPARPPGVVLPEVAAQLLRVEERPPDDGPAPDWSVVEDYQTMVGPALPVAQHLRWRIPVWFSWRMRRVAPGLRVPIEGLFTALERLGLTTGASIEYLVCRQTGTAALRGKGKLGIPRDVLGVDYPGTATLTGAEQLCADLEEAWAACLATDTSGAQVRGISVSSRESWLGQWT